MLPALGFEELDADPSCRNLELGLGVAIPVELELAGKLGSGAIADRDLDDLVGAGPACTALSWRIVSNAVVDAWLSALRP